MSVTWTHEYCYASLKAGPDLVVIAYPDATTTNTVTLLLWQVLVSFHSLHKGNHTDATSTITVTLLLWQVLALFSSPIQRLSHRCHCLHHCYTSFMARSVLVLFPYPKVITQMPQAQLLLFFFYSRS